MLRESVELTMSHVGLGGLNEFALMTLFGNAHSHAITAGTGHSIRQIVDERGAVLYPAYYLTHLQVPPSRLINRFQVWDNVDVSVDVHTLGGLLLSSKYCLAPVGQTPSDPAAWSPDELVTMRGGNTFTVDGVEGEAQPATPKRGSVAELPKLSAVPDLLARFREVRSSGVIDPSFKGNLVHKSPAEYTLLEARDIFPGHGVMFATFVTIMDFIERRLLTQDLTPAFPIELLTCMTILERETCYLGNLRGAQDVQGSIKARLTPCAEDFHGSDRGIASAAILTSVIELYQKRTNSLLIVSKSKKLFAVPRERQGILTDAKRMLYHHGSTD